ncbi:uncharacterized protein LOC129287034 [Prosopis cineraria]|uniref:uncharacterized protein LOC129287034 n=1 Tax=Prosopis cineraria TaxID=364024 RepID=UPI00240FC771|nr:uncharacterized protein LOC129287034 [Prosopis cineraria]
MYEPLQLRSLDREMHVHEVHNAPLIGSLRDVEIIGSSNGLLCVAIHETDISTSSLLLCNSLLLWNPAIGEVRQIPRTRTVKFEEGIGSSTERWSSTKKCACKGPSNMLQLGCIWRNEMVCSDSGMHRNTDESEGEVENDEQKAVIYLLNMTTNEFKKVAIPRGGYFFNYVDSFFKHVESLVPDGIGNIHFEEH